MGRGKSWAVDEDVGLCRAFVATTAEGNTDFFGRMYHKFITLAPSGDAAEPNRWRARTERALKKRLVIIRPPVLDFCFAFAAARAASPPPLPEDRAVLDALAAFAASHPPLHPDAHAKGIRQSDQADASFNFLHCWRILREAPPFRGACDGTVPRPPDASPRPSKAPAPSAQPGTTAAKNNAVEDDHADDDDDDDDNAAVASATAAPQSVGFPLPGVPATAGSLGTAAQQPMGGLAPAQQVHVQAAGAGAQCPGKKRRRAPAAADADPGLAHALGGDLPGAATAVLGVGDGVGEGADLARLAAAGERLGSAAEDLCGVLLFQRSAEGGCAPNPDRKREYFELMEEKYLNALRRSVETERQQELATANGGDR